MHMKYLLSVWLFFYATALWAQPVDSIRMIEPDKETSFENYELLAVAILGFLLLVGLWFWIRHKRKSG